MFDSFIVIHHVRPVRQEGKAGVIAALHEPFCRDASREPCLYSPTAIRYDASGPRSFEIQYFLHLNEV
jgi:hypothetical protein